MSNEYTEDRIAMALAPRPVRYVPSVESTNDLAAAWLAEDTPDGAVVVADEQTAGRGRHGRTWHTPPGVALAASVVVKPNKPDAAGVNMAGALAVQRTLQTLNIAGLSIKWANDVLVNSKKISGVLPEVIWNGDDFAGIILGMGVNVRNDFSGTVLDGQATTVEAETERQIDRVTLLTVLLYQLDTWLDRLGTDMLLSAYRAELRDMIGQYHRDGRGWRRVRRRAGCRGGRRACHPHRRGRPDTRLRR